MGTLLLAVGSPGCRHPLPSNSRSMLHQPSEGTQGMVSDIDIQAKDSQPRRGPEYSNCVPNLQGLFRIHNY